MRAVRRSDWLSSPERRKPPDRDVESVCTAWRGTGRAYLARRCRTVGVKLGEFRVPRIDGQADLIIPEMLVVGCQSLFEQLVSARTDDKLGRSGSKNHESVSVTDLARFMIRRLQESKCGSSIKSFLDVVCCDAITRLIY